MVKIATCTVLVLGLLLQRVSDAADDEAKRLEPGARVRLVAPAPQKVAGTRVTDNETAETDKIVSYLSSGELAPRTYTRPGEDVTGTVVRVTDDAIVLETVSGQRSIHVARAALTKLEVSVAPSRKKRGAAWGAIAGLGAALIYAAAVSDEDKLFGDFGYSFAAGAFLFIPSGAAVGAIVAPGERWQPGALNESDRGFGLSFAIRF